MTFPFRFPRVAALAAILFACLVVPVLGADVSWSPASSDPLRLELNLAEALLDRGVPSLADARLEQASTLLPNAPQNARERYGVLATRAALETADLGSEEGIAATRERIDQIRANVEGRDLRRDVFEYFAAPASLDRATLRYALALVKAYCALGTLETDLGAESSPSLADALELSQKLAVALSGREARVFLFWNAKAALANRGDAKRLATAAKLASALEKSARDAKDDSWFFARILLIEIARDSGDFESARKRVQATLDALRSLDDSDAAPREFAAALVAQEIRLLDAEGKRRDALRQASSENDLLDAPFPENPKRLNEAFYDVFDDLNLARAQIYWRTIPETPTREELERGGDKLDSADALAREALVDEARRVAQEIADPVAKARIAIAARDVGEASEDWSAIELVAKEAYRSENWRDAIDEYDRAARAAESANDRDDAFRLRAAAAAILDKLLRDGAPLPDADETALREDAAERFDALACERLEAPEAPAFFRVALRYRESLQEDDDYARFEYLKLFPNAPDRGAFALALAQRLLTEKECDDAARALDAASDDAVLPEALALERALYATRVETAPDDAREAILVEALDRLLARLPGEKRSDATTLDALAARLDRLEFQTESERDALVANAFFRLVIDSPATQNAAFSEAAARALRRLRDAARRDERDASKLADLDALRLSLALATDDRQEIDSILQNDEFEGAVELPSLERALDVARDAAPETRARLARFVLDALARSDDQSARAMLARAEALRLVGKTQESLNLFARIRNDDPKNVAAARGIARILSDRRDAATRARALRFWSDVADLCRDSSKEWWDAKEESFRIYCSLGETEQAEKLMKTLWLAREDPSDPGRRRRWEQTLENARRGEGSDAR